MSLLHLLIKLTRIILKKTDNYWIQILKTMVPWGLNILNSVWTTRIRTLFSFSGILGHGRFTDKIHGHNILLFRICLYVYIYVCVCARVCVYVYIYIYVCVCVYIYMYVCIYMYLCVCSIIPLFIHYLHTIPFVSYSIAFIAVFNLVLASSDLTQ